MLDGLIGAAGSLGTSLVNNLFTAEANRVTQAREDNAVQRRVADLRAAGLSPTLAAGSAAAAEPVRAMEVSDPIAAGSALMQTQGSIAHTAADKARISQAERLGAAQTREAEAKAKQETIKAEAMQDLEDTWQARPFDTRTRGEAPWRPAMQKEVNALLEGAARANLTTAAGSEAATSAESAALDLKAYKALGGSSAVGGPLLKLGAELLRGIINMMPGPTTRWVKGVGLVKSMKWLRR